ncbi:DUF6460 domain-containing protein [Tianweitania sediminis]|jgi:hypothetical protein|uniref:DUF6460 domain-containing protein n=1 Tax=Tianweitania sediminis TaxID=1502156 RepID=A0A8J7R1P7_9HYPH|nr:DUF6460 domain-containing protein [Tianweitania sediminis]MBP0440585.1 hypothetical protein [Tianweitania sediminis]HEV7415882.1 DUF6460 domain-containing protein [Tianweitania sediminis]
MSGTLTRFLGDSPLRILIKLVVVSFLVGILMAAFDWTPMDIIGQITDVFYAIWNMGFFAVDRFVGYLLLGAAIVVPVFLLLRLLNWRR